MNTMKNFLVGKTFAVRDNKFDISNPMIEGICAEVCECPEDCGYERGCSGACESCPFNVKCADCKFSKQCEYFARVNKEVLATFFINKDNKLTVRYANLSIPSGVAYYTWSSNYQIAWDIFRLSTRCGQWGLKTQERLARYKEIKALDTSCQSNEDVYKQL